jgi:endogenous inhibitor of DNA gyrase (YacG/DUF329 family)
MKSSQKEQIKKLRGAGCGYGGIAKALCLPENTVKSYCKRHGLGGYAGNIVKANDGIYCRCCFKPLEQIPGYKQRKFCSDECRTKWWNAHPELVSRKAIYRFVCPVCGKEFESYGNAGRKFCSHECYVAQRFLDKKRRPGE